MKRNLSLLLALTMLLGLLAGCSMKTPEPMEDDASHNDKNDAAPEDQKSPQPASGEKDAEQYLNVLLTDEPSVLDVARFLGVTDRNLFMNLKEPLVRIENGEIVGSGAESWDISDDGLTYTFHLRENYWSDGQKVTAQDYITALQRQCDPANAFAFTADYADIKNFTAISKGEADPSTLGATAPDDNTLVLELEQINVALLASTDFFPDRADIAQQHGDTLGAEADKTPCCGPFSLKSWNHNSSLELTKNEKYWNAEKVYLQNVTYHIIPDQNAQLASLENGSLDYLGVSTPEYVTKFQGRDDMSEMMFSTGRTVMVLFNCEDPILSNPKIRMALSLSMDRDALVEVVTNGVSTPAYSLVPPDSYVGSLNFRENAEEPLEAVMAANPDPKALLIEGMKEAGLGEDPSKLTLTLSWGATTATARTYAELYQQIWQDELGCVIELEFNDNATHMGNVNNANYQLATFSWGADYEPQFQLSRWANKVGGHSRWKNEEYVSLVNQASQTQDEKERLELYAKAEKMLVEDAAMAPLYFGATRRFYYNYVHGLTGNAFDKTGFINVYTSGR